MDTTELIHNALEWANKRLELQGEPITENQRNYIVFALRQQLTIPAVVGRSEQLPTKNDFISELEQHQEKWKTAHNKKVNNAYALGFRHCFNFINDRVKLK